MSFESSVRMGWVLGVLVVLACGGKGDDDGGSDTDADCNCVAGSYSPVCGVDGMTHDATCGLSCVAVEIECMGECPCANGSGGSDGSGGMTSGASSGASTAAETTMGVDPCDCMLGAYFPACGVDGMTYDATCGLECVPVDVLCMAECPCPEIACGDALMCGPTEPVCTIYNGGAAGSETSYQCGAIPEACEGVVPPTCACVSDGCECVEGPPGYFQVTCNPP